MSGTTTELGLATAVDSDDNADYLTINLANSLRTVDGLFNNITGHTHGGAHQGAPVSPAAGSITGSMLANGTVTNAKLAADTARANLLTNGGFEVWQRGNGPFTTSVYTADRWLWNTGAGGSVSITRDQGFVDAGSTACAAIVYTHGSAASLFYQGGNDLYGQLRGKTVTFSARVKANAANAVRLLMSDGVSGNQFSSYHTGNNQYQTLTLTYNVATNATQLNPAFNFEASATVYIDNAMLVVGSQAADYAPLHPADDVARCLRYYEQKNAAAGWGLAMAHATSTTTAAWYWPFKAVKSVTPSITYQGATNYGAINSAGGVVQATGIGTYTVNVDQLYAHVDVASGLVAGNASQLSASASFGGTLVAEANP